MILKEPPGDLLVVTAVPTGLRITGRVLDDKDNPVPNAFVGLKGCGEHPLLGPFSETSESGSFELGCDKEELEPGESTYCGKEKFITITLRPEG